MDSGSGGGHYHNNAGPGGYPAWTPPVPSRPPRPPRKSAWQRPWVLVVGALGLVLALVAGTLLWQAVRPEEAEENQAPFYLAVHNLANEPVTHYTGSAPDGTSWDVTATDGDEAQGEITVDGRRIGVLKVAGKTYAKPPQDMLTDLPDGVSASTLKGKWITGDARLTRAMANVPGSPAALASRLWAGLDQVGEFPHTDAETVRIGRDEALSVATPEGVLYVTAAAPYRILRLAPRSTKSGHTTAAASNRTGLVTAAVRPSAAAYSGTDRQAAPAGQPRLGRVDFAPMSPEHVGRAYDDLIDGTKSLGGAVDLGVRFDFNQTGNLSCSESCTVTENVVTSTTAVPGAKLSGTVDATMTAQVTVNGGSGGGCSQRTSLPLNGSGTMRCVASGTAPVVRRIKAEKQREANARARATGRSVRIPYTLDFRAQVQIMAMAIGRAEIEKKVRDQQAERGRAVETAKQNAGPNPDCGKDSFEAGTPVLTDAGPEPIENIRTGDRVRNDMPGSAALQEHTVAGVVVTDTDRDFVELTVSGPRGAGTVRSTAHHLFYDATTAAWTRAADLEPGHRIQTTGGGSATVQEARAYSATVRTYNLSVDGVHTYYVLAGDTPVLVHNCAMKRDAKSLKGVKVPRQYEGLDVDHVRSNHFPGGAGVTSRKDLWPSGMTNERLENIARQALGNNPKVVGYDPQTRMIQGSAVVEGKLVQFQIPRGGGTMRSIYPLVPWRD
ncbi:polymorphic toxin-type HINT domain-containing protein [Streptomyces sp. NPDC006510]|uniref:polymorphic toxin-type HINT domain-containing protein n=1 Tax=Streptomyces sp. NPDC006510 TaxID=3155600 RepID=UPI0033B2CCC8